MPPANGTRPILPCAVMRPRKRPVLPRATMSTGGNPTAIFGIETVAVSSPPAANSIGSPSGSWPSCVRSETPPTMHKSLGCSGFFHGHVEFRAQVDNPRQRRRYCKADCRRGTWAERVPLFRKTSSGLRSSNVAGAVRRTTVPFVEVQLGRSRGQFQFLRREPIALGVWHVPGGVGGALGEPWQRRPAGSCRAAGPSAAGSPPPDFLGPPAGRRIATANRWRPTPSPRSSRRSPPPSALLCRERAVDGRTAVAHP